jgi:methylmalonyl-CoA epimerase
MPFTPSNPADPAFGERPPPLLTRLDHVGIVVRDMDEALATYCDQLGFQLLEQVTIEEQLVTAAFLNAYNSTIELISPTDEESGTARFLRNRGEGTHHICFEVGDIVAVLDEFRSAGVQLIDDVPRQGVHGLVAFVHPKATHGTMIELLQKDEH